MSSPAISKIPKPFELSDTDMADMADRTMELDMRWLQYEKQDDDKSAAPSNGLDDPTVVLDLTATQVHNLLKEKK